MAFFPVLGDEAYYFYWGMHPAGGYYDLPPMIGWWLTPFVKLALIPLCLRLPNLVAWFLVSASIYEWLSHALARPRAKLIAASFALLPVPFLAVLMFPDIPLLFFSYFSAYMFFRAATVEKKSKAFLFFFGSFGRSCGFIQVLCCISDSGLFNLVFHSGKKQQKRYWPFLFLLRGTSFCNSTRALEPKPLLV